MHSFLLHLFWLAYSSNDLSTIHQSNFEIFSFNHLIDHLYFEVSVKIFHFLLMSTLTKLALIFRNFISFLHAIRILFFD